MEELQSTWAALLSEDGLKLLDDIDRLRAQGINQYVELPQIVVVGDQSSGKSSVLDAISGVRFPANDGLCTRFATEVVLRRSSLESASVKILPKPGTTGERKLKLEGFQRNHATHLEVPKLIQEATKSWVLPRRVTSVKTN